MPTYRAPYSDPTRLAFMKKALEAAAQDAALGVSYADAAFMAEFTAHYEAYDEAYVKVQATLSARVRETAESVAALERLKMFISHAWYSVYHRKQRLDLPDAVLEFYLLNADGSRPSLSTRTEWEAMADHLVQGDAEAVLAGYVAMAEPTAVELQAALDASIAEAGDVIRTDREYDEAQEFLATFRATADDYIRELRDLIIFGTRKKEPPSQRRILRSYGAEYRYAPGEQVDEGDVTAVVDPTA